MQCIAQVCIVHNAVYCADVYYIVADTSSGTNVTYVVHGTVQRPYNYNYPCKITKTCTARFYSYHMWYE